jgi:hypothetical protein
MKASEKILKLIKKADYYDKIGLFNSADLINVKIAQIYPSLSDSTYDLSSHMTRWKDVEYDFDHASFLRNKHYRDKIPTYKELPDGDGGFESIEEQLNGADDTPGPALIYEDGFTMSNPGLRDLNDFLDENIEKEKANNPGIKYGPLR